MGRAKGETHQIAGPHLTLTRPRYSTPLLRSPPTHRAQVRSYKTPDTPRRRYAPNTPLHITRNENPSPHDLLQRLPLPQFVDQLVHVPRLPDKGILDFLHAPATTHAFDQRAVWMNLDRKSTRLNSSH